MITTKDILNFAITRKRFTRKELTDYLKSQVKDDSLSSLSEQLDRLLKSNHLVRLERGVYSLSGASKNIFIPFLSNELMQLNLRLRAKFPFINYCVWSSQSIAPYMHHIPFLNYTYVDVDRDVTEAVFDLLNSDSLVRVFLCPSQNDFSRYISGNESVIVRPLISEAPLQTIQGFSAPTIEKILVDVAGDLEFDFLQGAEISYFYRNVVQRHNISKSKLLRYATRRGRRLQVEQLYLNSL